MKRASNRDDDLFVDMEKMNEAMALAARDARRVHKQVGYPIAAWRDNAVVWVPVDELDVADEPIGQDSSESGSVPARSPAD